jgi:hypothetical protein
VTLDVAVPAEAFFKMTPMQTTQSMLPCLGNSNKHLKVSKPWNKFMVCSILPKTNEMHSG